MKQKQWIKVLALYLCFVVVGLPQTALCVRADNSTASASGATYELKLVLVADAKPNQFVWMIEEGPFTVYQSLQSPSLRWWVDDLPAGSTIEFAPGCRRIGGEPMDQVPAFKAYCESKKVKFVWIPSG